MNAFAVSGLFVLIPSAIVGVFTLIKGRRRIHLIWGTLCFSIALWGFGIYKIGTAVDMVKSFFWWRIAEIGVIFIPVLLVHFVFKFLEIQKKWLIIIFYLVTLGFLFLDLFTNYFIREVRFIFNQFYYISATPLYTLFVVIFVGSITYSIFKIWQAYKRSRGIIKAQMRYLLLAFSIAFIGGVTSFFPVYNINVYPVWNATIFISALMVSYAMIRYRLMDIRIIARKVFIYFVMAGLTYGTFYLVIWVYNKFLGGVYNFAAYLTGIVVAPAFVAIFYLINKWIQVFANKYLFFSLYNYQEAISRLTNELNYYIDFDKIINSVVETIKRTMQLDRAGVLLIEEKEGRIHYKIAKIIGFREENGISLVQDNFLTRYLRRIRKPLIREELKLLAKDAKSIQDKESFKQLYENMKKIEASLCLPLMSGNKLIGLIVLGSKISKDAYAKEDIELLDTLSKQAAIAIENARLYKEVQDFNKILQKKVNEQTKEIKKAYQKVERAYNIEKQARIKYQEAYELEKKGRDKLEKAAKEFKRLDEAKNQFMMATQHHLRTPLTSMYGYLELLLEGTFGKMSKSIKEVLERFRTSTKNEIKIVEDLLNVSQFQLGKEVVILKPNIDIEPILDEIKDDLLAEVQSKEIYLKLEKPDKVPRLRADPQKLKIALFNIIDNAVKYTEKGGITVQLKIKPQKLTIIIKDTGMGIPQEEQKHLFTRIFERGKKAKKVFATGRGIGLYIASKIIKAHKGKVWAKSEGINKGSTFYIELPIK